MSKYKRLTRVAENSDGSFAGIWLLNDNTTQGDLTYNLAEYEELGTPDDFRELKNKSKQELKQKLENNIILPCIINRPPFWYVLSDKSVGEIELYKYMSKELAQQKFKELEEL